MRLKFEYYIENQKMTDSEYANQLPKTFILTEDMVKKLIREVEPLNIGDDVSDIYLVKS